MWTSARLLALLACVGAAFSLAFAPAPLPRSRKISRLPMGQDVVLEVEGDRARNRRVVVAAKVCLREGPLEHLLTRKGGKEHESILSADVDARDIHKALLAAGVNPGSPARFAPGYAPASGQAVRITLQWQEKGKPRRIAAGQWVRDVQSKTALARDWVFAGSRLLPNPKQPGRLDYLANQGDVICLANFEGALLDLPIRSSKEQADLAYEAFTERIPPLGTEIHLVLEPAPRVGK